MKNRLIVVFFLLSSIVFFVLGLCYPILATKQQVFGLVLTQQSVKLFDSVKMFFESGDYLLATIIFLFTIALPIVKFFELTNRIVPFIKTSKRVSSILHKLDKWSMLDVFLVALLLLNFKMDSNIIVMKLKAGTTFIALSIIFRMFVSVLIDKYLKNSKEEQLKH